MTIATIPVTRQAAQSLGIMQINAERQITRFVEKPKDPAVLDSLKLDKAAYPRLGIEGDEEFFLASMGIYVFNRDMLIKLLDNTHTDFGKHIIPGAIDAVSRDAGATRPDETSYARPRSSRTDRKRRLDIPSPRTPFRTDSAHASG